MTRRPVGHASPAEPVTELPQVPAGPGQGASTTATLPRPRCASCRQPMPWHPPLCTCGHPVSSHHETGTGNLTYCCNGGPDGNCGCGRYAQASDGYYGPLKVAS